jgi:hypothetical protein
MLKIEIETLEKPLKTLEPLSRVRVFQGYKMPTLTPTLRTLTPDPPGVLKPLTITKGKELGAGLLAPDSTRQHHRTIEKVLLFIVLSGVMVMLSRNGPTLDSTIECYKVLYRARLILFHN